MKDKIVIYHGNCPDGFASAYLMRHRFGHEIERYIPGVYEEGPAVAGIKDKDVYIVDFSYPENILRQMAKSARSVHIYDHHKSIMEDLAPVIPTLPDNIFVTFDMDMCGAMLVFHHFIKGTKYHDKASQDLAKYIDDRDRWVWQYPESRAILMGLDTHPFSFEAWDSVVGDLKALYDVGAGVDRFLNKQMDIMLQKPPERMLIGGYDVPAINAPHFMASDLGNRLAQGEHFASVFIHHGGKIKFSLRSEENGLDVSAICKLYGGGGHKHAGGFSVNDFSDLNLSIPTTLKK